jgi:hypothetical protein
MQKALGLNDHQKVFKEIWEANNIPTLNKGFGKITTNRQAAFADEDVRENFKGFASNHLKETLERQRSGEMHQKAAMDEPAVSGATPLVFDPDFISILREEAPLMERVPQEGQQGFSAEYIRIDSRDDAIGFTSESDILDLTNNNKAGIGFKRGSTDMEIWVDLVEISDFAAAGSDFFFDVRDTTLGERVANASQAKERAMLYGDPSVGSGTGDLLDANAYEGFATVISDDAGANNDVDKSTTDIGGTDGFVKDIKAEIKDMVQSNKRVNKSDLEIWTSHTAFDHLENEAEVKRRVSADANSVDYGFETFRISGVDTFASHNVTEHDDNSGGSGAKVGSEGDVFIMNRREMRDRALMPMSTVPLARLGFGELVAMGEFSAPILRGNGHLSRYLKNYQI